MNYDLVSKIYLILCWMFFIFFLLVIPIYSSGEPSFTVYDKVFHFFVFGILAGLVSWSFYDKRRTKKLNFDATVFVFATAYILLMEYIQSFLASRAPSLWDAVSGLAGVFIGILIINNYLPLKRSKK